MRESMSESLKGTSSGMRAVARRKRKVEPARRVLKERVSKKRKIAERGL